MGVQQALEAVKAWAGPAELMAAPPVLLAVVCVWVGPAFAAAELVPPVFVVFAAASTLSFASASAARLRQQCPRVEALQQQAAPSVAHSW
jgi:hypothetical protein